jgi:hypothetical protein
VNTWRVEVKPWVEADVAAAVGHNRQTINDVSFDLHNRLPAVRHAIPLRRPVHSPRCFWYSRTFAAGLSLHYFDFVVRDATPGLLEVIWVRHTA